MAPLSDRVKELAQVFDQVSARDSVLIIRRQTDFERELIIVLNAFDELIIRYYHEGFCGADQAPKAKLAKKHVVLLVAGFQTRCTTIHRMSYVQDIQLFCSHPKS